MSIRLRVQGMNCSHCEETVEDALSAVSGVTAVRVDHTDEQAEVEGSPNLEDLIAAVDDAGYDASPL